MKAESLKIIASTDDIAVRAVDIYINSRLLSLSGYWQWDLNCDTIFCSDVMAALTQHYPGTKAIIHPDDIEYVRLKIAAFEDESANIEFRIITTYGEVKKISGRECFLKEVNELRVSNPENDIIEKAVKEKEFEKISEELHLLKSISDHAETITKTGKWYINAVTLETYYSDNVFRIHGILPQSLNAHPHTFSIFIHPDDNHTVTEAFDKSFRERLPLHIEYRIMVSDEKEKFITLNTHWSHNLKGEDVLNGIIKDRSQSVFELTKAEAAENKLEFHSRILQMNEKLGNTAFWYMNLLTRQTFYSDNYYRIHGLKPQSAPARPAIFINYVHPDDRERVAESINKIRIEHAAPDIEYRVIRSDKKLRHIRQKAQLVSFAGNELVMIATIHDVSAQVYHEKKLKELEEVLLVKNFIQGQSDQMAKISSWMWEPETGNSVWSSNLYDLLGYKKTVKEITQQSLLKAVLPEDRKMFSDEMNAVAEGAGEREFIFRILKTGEVRIMKACFKLLNYEERKYFVGTMQDITESMQLQEQLDENLQLNQLLSENILDKVFITDVHNNIILWNKKCEDHFRLKKEQVIGKNYFDIFPEQKTEKTIIRFNDVLNGEVVHELGEKSSAKKYHDLHMTPLKDKSNKILGILHIMHDVTRELHLHNSLNERLNFIENLLEETVDRIIVLDKNLTYSYWNKKAEEYYHINKEYVIGKNLFEVFPSFVKDPFYLEFKKVLKGETVHIGTTIDSEHQEKFSETYLVPLLNDNKEVNGILWIVHDLSKDAQLQKQQAEAAEQIKQTKDLLESTFAAVPTGLCVMNAVRDEAGKIADFEFVLVNKETEKGTRRNDLPGKRLFEVYPEAKKYLFEAMIKTVETGENSTVEFFYPHDHFNSWHRNSYAKFGDGVIEINENISERKFTEEELKRNKETVEKQNKIFEYAEQIANMGTWIWNPETNKSHYSDNMFRLFGMEPQEVEPNFDTIPKFIHPEDRQIVLDSAKDLKEGNATVIEYRVIRKDGVLRNFRNRTQIIDLNNEKYVIGTTQDITELHQKDIAQKTWELLSKKKDEFISIASHELKTPVTNIKASLQILQDLLEDSSEKENVLPFLERSANQVNKLTELINDLLDASIMDTGEIKIKKSIFNIGEALQESADEICSRIKECEIKIKGENEVLVMADKVRVQQVISNYLTNAIKYSPHHKTVYVTLERNEQMVKISVTDKGIGISEEDVPHLFEKYFRVDASSKKFSGLGLGLYISKEIIKKHGGTVGVSSSEGIGSTFWFTFPLFPTNTKTIL
ncbi:MAG TPA: PAS domain-containing protein [Chitinophagaceae bacterium]|nr:PAS domain-containing protein [Chitinophagaceae bacterium]